MSIFNFSADLKAASSLFLETSCSVDIGKRVIEFDWLEALSIYLVCSIHYPVFSSNSICSQIWHFFALTAVPIFFAVHGALLLRKQFNFKKHLKRLIKTVKYLILFKLVVYCLFLLFGLMDPIPTISGLLNYFITCSDSDGFPVEHTWFIYALISIYFVYPVIALAFQENRKVVTAIGLSFLIALMCCNALNMLQISLFGTVKYSFMNAISFANPFGIWSFYLCIFICGPWIFDFLKHYIGIRCVVLAFLAIFSGIALLMFEYFALYGTYCWTGQVLPDQYIQFGVALEVFGLVVLINNICPAFEGTRIVSAVQQLSENTLFIFYLHMPVLWLMNYCIGWKHGFISNLMRAAVVFIVIAIVGVSFKRLFKNKPSKKMSV